MWMVDGCDGEEERRWRNVGEGGVYDRAKIHPVATGGQSVLMQLVKHSLGQA